MAEVVYYLRESRTSGFSLSAEAVEKANLLDDFIPDFCLHRIHQKTRITNYNLYQIVVLCYPWPIIIWGG